MKFFRIIALLISLLAPLNSWAISGTDLNAVLHRSEIYSDDACTSPDSGGPLVGSDHEEQAFNFFLGKGLTPIQAAALVGNFYGESHVDPQLQEYNKPHGALNSPLNGTGYGIAQWTFTSRQQPLVDYANSHNLAVSSLEAQLGYAWQELNSSYKSVLDELKTKSTLADASYLILVKYLTPADIPGQTPIRLGDSEKILKLYGSGSAAQAASTATGCTASSDNSGGVSVASGQIPFPINAPVVDQANWTEDQGVDIATSGGKCGQDAPLVAMGDGEIVQVGINGFGQWAPVLHVTSGPLKDRYIYYGHAKPNRSNVGDKVQAGDVIAYVGCGIVGLSTGPHLEIGIWPQGKTPSDSFPTKYETSAEMLKLLKAAYSQGHK